MGAARRTRLVGAVCIGLGTVGVVAPLALADPDDFSMTSTTMGFGSVFVGETGTETLIIRNTSDTALAPVTTGGLLDAGGPFESSTTCDGGELEPDDTCVFEYTYTPETVGADQVDVGLTLEGVNYQVSLTGTGVAPIEVSSPALAFGAVVVGEKKELDLTVTNVSNISRTPVVSAPVVESDVFSGTSTCDGDALAAGASCAVTYEFAPTAAGAATGSDLIMVDGGTHIVSLTGNGVPATTPTAVVANDGPVIEGSTATVSFTEQDDPGDAIVEPFVYSYDWDSDGTFEILNGSAATAPVPAALTADGPATVSVTARITNQIGRYTEYETDVVVQNAAPVLTVSGPDGVAVGASGALTVSVADPGSAAEEYAYAVDWDGDGTTDQTVTGAASRSIVHTFAELGTFDVEITVTDGDGGSDAATHVVTVAEDDPSATPTPTDTPTDTPSPTDTPTDSPSPTDTPTDTPSPSDTPTPAPTDTPAPSYTPTPEPSVTPHDYNDDGTLPETGAGIGDVAVLAGALLIGLGALLLFTTRRPVLR